MGIMFGFWVCIDPPEERGGGGADFGLAVGALLSRFRLLGAGVFGFWAV